MKRPTKGKKLKGVKKRSRSFFNDIQNTVEEEASNTIFGEEKRKRKKGLRASELILHKRKRDVFHTDEGEYYTEGVESNAAYKKRKGLQGNDHFFLGEEEPEGVLNLFDEPNEFFHDDEGKEGADEKEDSEDEDWVRVRNKAFSEWLISRDYFESREWKANTKTEKQRAYELFYEHGSRAEKKEFERLQKERGENPNFESDHFTSHFTLTLPAMRKSGKSTVIERLLSKELVSKDADGNVDPIQFFQYKILIKPTAYKDPVIKREHFDEIICGDDAEKSGEDVATYINNAISKIMYRKKDFRTLVVLDDILGEIGHSGNHLINRFTTRNRHHDTSIILASQNMKGVSPTIRVNTSIWMIFRVLNKGELKKMREEMEAVNQFYDRMEYRNHPFTFMLIRVDPGPKILVFRGFDEYLGEVTD